MHLLNTLVDLTKSSDTVSRSSLYKVLRVHWMFTVATQNDSNISRKHEDHHSFPWEYT